MESNLSRSQSIELQKDKEMCAKIRNLPDVLSDREFKNLNWHQKQVFQIRRNFWKVVGARIYYLLCLQHGLNPNPSEDPCQYHGFDLIEIEWLRIFCNYIFCIFQLLGADQNNRITGFSIVRDWAKSHGREFSFCDYRELFIEICRDHANSGWKIHCEGHPGLEKTKAELRTVKKLFKGELEEKEATEILGSWVEESWSLAWTPAIHSQRYKDPFLNYWKKFDQAHDCLAEFICRPSSEHAKQGVRLHYLGIDRHGRPIDLESKQVVDFEEIE